MKKLLASLLFVSIFQIASAQDASYYMSGGLRAGFSSGVTGKIFFSDNLAFEGIVGLKYFRETVLIGLVEFHQFKMWGVDRLSLFYGGGLHVGYRYTGGQYVGKTYVSAVGPVVGVDAIAGFEYELSEFPVTLSLDIKPNVDFLGFYPAFFDSAISIRYILE